MYYLCNADTTTKFHFGKNKQMFRLGFRGETFLYIHIKKPRKYILVNVNAWQRYI